MDIYNVGQLTTYLKEWLDSDPFLSDLWLAGELSNVSRSAAGHLYFTLKDSAGQMRSVMFKSALAGDVAAVDGAAVVAHGRVAFYEVRGELQFIVDVLVPQGAGELHMEQQRLKAKLEAEGLFAESRKRRIPQFPRRIAVITSPAGAVLRDIATVIARRYPLVELLIAPVPVQGDQASVAIEAAFRRLNQQDDIDLVILARGGGSLEELWPFNEERTVRAVYGSRAPVICGVGHETDTTLCDYAADLRAATPSAAAELAVPSRRDLQQRAAGLMARLGDLAVGAVAAQRGEVAYLARRLAHNGVDVDKERQRLDEISHTVILLARGGVAAGRSLFNQQMAALTSLDPTSTLARGYAIVTNRRSGRVVRRTEQAPGGDPLDVQVSDGTFAAVAEGVALGRARRRRPVPAEQMLLLPPARG